MTSADSHSPPAAEARFRLCAELFRAQRLAPATVLDIGGSSATATWLSTCFPGASISVLNSDQLERADVPVIYGDAQDFTLGPVDLIFAGELIEHLWNPDGLVESASRSLAPGGWLVITTPNLLCLANRIFAVLGWTLGNYSASIRYITGNPMLPTGTGEIGTVAFHKSVFSLRQLVDLLALYGFELVAMRGYSYAPPPGVTHRGLGGREVRSGGYGLRRALNTITPHRLREGMALLLLHRPDKRSAPPLTIAEDIPNI